VRMEHQTILGIINGKVSFSEGKLKNGDK